MLDDYLFVGPRSLRSRFTRQRAFVLGFIVTIATTALVAATPSSMRRALITSRVQSMSIDTRSMNSGTTTALDQCFTLPFEDGATAAECGNLRVVHPLPATRVRGVTRTSTLLYNSQHAHPAPVVRANVTMPSGTVSSAVATLQLMVSGTPVTVATESYSGSQLPGDSTRRIALGFDGAAYGTGVYPYTLTVSATVNGSPVQVQSTDSLVIVNRIDSEFGAGWWLAGYERLLQLPSGAMLWIGGDGSTRLYRYKVVGGAAVLTTWMTDSVTYPDSIMKPLFSNTFTRFLPGGGRVLFDNDGQHVATIDRLDDSTTFTRNASGLLSAVTLPRVSLAYAFTYNASLKLSQVTAPTVSGATRVTTVKIVSGRTTGLTAPDGIPTGFQYATADSQRMIRRTDRMNVGRYFTYDAAKRVSGSYVDSAGTQQIVWSICAAESRGVLGGVPCGVATPPDTASAGTIVDGPRVVSEVYTIGTNRLGAATTVRNPHGYTSTVRRDDSRFPGLVTSTVDPMGFTRIFAYDARGNVIQQRDLNPLRDGPGSSALTSFTYGSSLWPDGITTIYKPMGGTETFTYDAHGNVLSHEDYRGAASRSTFTYGAGGSALELLVRVVHPEVVAGRTDLDSLQYDALGNVSDMRVATRSGGSTIVLSASHMLRDAIGRTSSVCIDTIISASPPQQCTTTQFDRMDRDSLVVMSGPLGGGTQSLTTRNWYDAEGRLTRLDRTSSNGTIGTITSQWVYDFAGRRTQEIAPDLQSAYSFYDQAGNLERLVTRRADTVTMTYSLTNELLTRARSGVTYASVSDMTVDTAAFPWRPNNGTGFWIAPDTARFTYDSAGRMLTANNRDARVTRAYFPNGLVESERQELRDAPDAATTFGHDYLLRFAYDYDGRRRAVKLPSQLVPSGTSDSIATVYNPYTGDALAKVDPLGYTFTYFYTVRGEPVSLDFPNGYQQQWMYSAAGNDSLDVVANNGGTGGGRISVTSMRNARSTFDARNLRRNLYDAAGFRDTVRFAYSGLGHLTSSYYSQFGSVLGASAPIPVRSRSGETRTYDALGNSLIGKTVDTTTARGTGGVMATGSASTTQYQDSSVYQAGVGRLLTQISIDGTKSHTYDPAGNVSFYKRLEGSAAYARFREGRASYYAADDQLHAADYRWRSVGPIDYDLKRVFETYRYDALGRRVWTRTDRQCSFPSDNLSQAFLECDLSTMRRTVWDGEQELIEIQTPVRLASSAAEQPASVQDDDLYHAGLPRAVGGQDPNPFFGRIVYTHGLTVDQPISLTRYDYVDYFFGATTHVAFPPRSVSLVWSSLGKASLAMCADGKAQCTHTDSGRTANMIIGIPAMWFAYERPQYVQGSFSGTLLSDKQDGTRTHYRRNRYYDPSSGRFTQEDPIGFAGGLNLYGFAGSDPANFSDPFGLCPDRLAAGLGSLQCVLQDMGSALTAGPSAIDDFVRSSRGAFVADLAMLPLTFVGGAEAGGLRGASSALKSLYANGGISGKSIIGIRAALVDGGFRMSLSDNRLGYLFKKGGEEVRIMSRNGGWEVRVRNQGGTYLDALGHGAKDRASSHGNKVFSK